MSLWVCQFVCFKIARLTHTDIKSWKKIIFFWTCLFDIMYYYCVNDIKCDFFVPPALMFWSWLCCVCCVGTYKPTQRHTHSNTHTHTDTHTHTLTLGNCIFVPVCLCLAVWADVCLFLSVCGSECPSLSQCVTLFEWVGDCVGMAVYFSVDECVFVSMFKCVCVRMASYVYLCLFVPVCLSV